MVVVVVIAILAVIALPSMAVAREDRLAFREAETFAHIIHNARTRAMARGAAQLVTITTNGTSDRGQILTYETLDASGRPQSPCKLPSQWSDVPGGGARNPLLAGENMNGDANSLQVIAGLQSKLQIGGAALQAAVICFTPGGRVYVTSGDTVAAAVAALPLAQPFTSDLSFTVMRMPGGGAAVGVQRRIIVTAAGGTRLTST